MNGDDLDKRMDAAFGDLPEEFEFFREVYATNIQPRLTLQEETRQKEADTARRFTTFGVAGAIFAALFSLIAFRSPIGVFLGGIIGFGLHSFGRQGLKKLSNQAKQTIVGEVASGFDMSFEAEPAPPPLISRFRNLKLVGDWDRSSFEDQLIGQRNGADFEFFEAHLERRERSTNSRGQTTTRYVTVFRGQCLAVNFHKEFKGKTLVRRDQGLFNMFGGLGQNVERVALEDPRFEKAFEVYSDDQVEARFILTPDFMEQLLELEETFHGGKLRCAFSGGELFLCVEGSDLFEPGSMFTPLDTPDRVRELLMDFTAVFGLIDSVADRRRRPT